MRKSDQEKKRDRERDGVIERKKESHIHTTHRHHSEQKTEKQKYQQLREDQKKKISLGKNKIIFSGKCTDVKNQVIVKIENRTKTDLDLKVADFRGLDSRLRLKHFEPGILLAS